jgi:DNA-binding LacI/PurR family transcriptional regulator
MARRSDDLSTQPTMRDVARLANVSQSTVSRVLNRTASPIPVGDETRQRILGAIDELGYHPNAHARSLRGQKTRMIAMMIADISNSFYHPMVRAVQDFATERGYDVMLTNSDHRRADEERFCESIMRRPVDGLIMVPFHLSDEEIDVLQKRTGAAIACLGQHVHHPEVDVIFGQDSAGAYEAAHWLVAERSHRRIAFIGVNPVFAAGARRFEAFAQVLQEAEVALPSEYLQEGDWSMESGCQAMRALLSLPQPPTAVFACNDLMAIGAILAAQEMGLTVPDDVAVVGFDNIAAGLWIRPRLTTVAQYPVEIGQHMARALFERIEDEYSGPGRRIEMPCCLIQRESA